MTTKNPDTLIKNTSGKIIPIASGVINGVAGSLRSGSSGASLSKFGTGRYELTISIPDGVEISSALAGAMTNNDYENAIYYAKAVVVDSNTVKVVCQITNANTYSDLLYINFVVFGVYT